MDKVIDVPIQGPAVPRVPTLAHKSETSGLRTIALRPGEVEVSTATEVFLTDVNLNNVSHEIAVNSDRLKGQNVKGETVAWYPKNTEIKLRVKNQAWGLLIEIDPQRADNIEAEALDGGQLPSDHSAYRSDPTTALLGRHLVAHLRKTEIDQLFAEGLGLAITARAIGVTTSGKAMAWTGGVLSSDPRMSRAIDYIETHLGSSFSVGDLAAIAAMSPGHFSRCFRTAVGEPVWAYVDRRRCERARDLLAGTQLSLAEIAYSCGFCSQAHMTHRFGRAFGSTPAAIRREASV